MLEAGARLSREVGGFAEAMRERLEERGVTAYISGHDHCQAAMTSHGVRSRREPVSYFQSAIYVPRG